MLISKASFNVNTLAAVVVAVGYFAQTCTTEGKTFDKKHGVCKIPPLTLNQISRGSGSKMFLQIFDRANFPFL